MTINQIDSTDYPLMPETLPEHSQGHKSAPDGTEDEAQSVMAATTPALLHLATRGTTRAIVTMVVAVRTALFMVAATAAFNFGNFNQAAGSQFSQRLLDRHGVRIEYLDATAAQAIEHASPDSAGADDGVDMLWCCMARTGTGVDAKTLAADAINHQQRGRRTKIRGDF